MKAFQMKSHQSKAISAIEKALNNNQKHMVVEMPIGSGISFILAKTAEILCKTRTGNILVVTGRMEQREQLKHMLSENYTDFVQIDETRIKVDAQQKILTHADEYTNEYQYLLFYDTTISEKLYAALQCNEKTVVVFSASPMKAKRLFTPNEIVFSYTYEEAVKDGIITPAMDIQALGPAVELFGRQLLAQFGFNEFDMQVSKQDHIWDLLVKRDAQKIYVNFKTFRSQVVSPSAASTLLNTAVMQKMKQGILCQNLLNLKYRTRVAKSIKLLKVVPDIVLLHF